MERPRHRSTTHRHVTASAGACLVALAFFATVGGLEARTVVNAGKPDLLEVSPVTDRILMLHFREGHIDYFQPPEDRYSGNSVYYGFLDLDRATTVGSYEITSPDDPAYSSPRQPLRTGRKSKGFHFHNLYSPGEPPYLSDHWIYLELPTPLQRGKRYTLRLQGLAYNRSSVTVRFDELELRSETVHVNQVGYRTYGKKYAYLSHFMGDFHSAEHPQGGLNLDAYADSRCRVVEAEGGKEVFSTSISLQQRRTAPDSNADEYGPFRNFTNADVWQCDFSSVTTPGYYRIVVDRIGSSFPFYIGEDVYRDAFHTAMRGLFFQRQGIDREIREFGDLIYPADYRDNPLFYLPGIGREEVSEIPDTSRPLTGIWGWYHDAGDWDTYCWTHADVPAMLLLLYEMRPDRFGDGDVGNRWRRDSSGPWIDEGADGIPDILDEAAWYVRFLRRARTALSRAGYGTGGVPAYIGIEAGHPDPAKNASWLDDRALAVTGEDAGVTAVYAGLAAWLGNLYERLGLSAERPEEWLAEARAAYEWAVTHDPPAEELLFGAAALYFATGDPAYQEDFAAKYSFSGEYWAGPAWDQLAACLFALLPDDHPELDRALRDQVRTAVRAAADQYWVNPGLNRGFRATHITPNQRNLLGTFSTPRTLFPAVAYILTGDERYLDAVQFAADYTLGGNPMNWVWMSGLGHRPEPQPFHMDSWSLLHLDSQVYVDPIIPGLVPYGTHHTGDWFDGPGWSWIGDEDYSRSTAYPVIRRRAGDPGDRSIFPAAEARFPNRHNIAASEYTIHQNQIHAAFTFGFLCGTYRSPYRPNERPWVHLRAEAEELSVAPGQELELEVRVSADTKTVSYYLDWHFLEAASRRERFRLRSRIDFPAGVYRLTAVAVDDRGLTSLPSEKAEIVLRVAAEPPPPPGELEGEPGDGRAYLRWRPAPRAAHYRVKRAEQATGPFQTIGSTTSTAFVDGPLENGKTYYYAVSAANSFGESMDSAPVAVTPRPVNRSPRRAGTRGS
ncbi:MAG: hypothetical protein Kow00109_21970 [Acidobacteriota bacterium]